MTRSISSPHTFFFGRNNCNDMAEHSGGLQGPRAHRQTPVTTSNDLSHDCPKVNNLAGNSSLKVRVRGSDDKALGRNNSSNVPKRRGHWPSRRSRQQHANELSHPSPRTQKKLGGRSSPINRSTNVGDSIQHPIPACIITYRDEPCRTFRFRSLCITASCEMRFGGWAGC